MALGAFDDQSFGPDEVTLRCRFQVTDPAGTADPNFIAGGAMAVSDVVRTGEGVYELTLAKGCAFEDMVTCIVQSTDPVAIAKFTSWTFSTRKLVVTVYGNDGSPAAADPADDSWVHVVATFCRRTKPADVRAI